MSVKTVAAASLDHGADCPPNVPPFRMVSRGLEDIFEPTGSQSQTKSETLTRYPKQPGLEYLPISRGELSYFKMFKDVLCHLSSIPAHCPSIWMGHSSPPKVLLFRPPGLALWEAHDLR